MALTTDPSDGSGGRTLFAALAEAAQMWGDKDLLVVARRGDAPERISFEGLRSRASRFAEGLEAVGVRSGDRVAIALPNSVDWFVAAFGASRAGAVIVPISTRLVARELDHCLRLTEPRAVVMSDVVRRRNLVDEWGDVLRGGQTADGAAAPCLIIRSTGEKNYPGAVRWQEDDLHDVSHESRRYREEVGSQRSASTGENLRDAAVIIFTSGTTAAPKGAVQGAESLLRLATEVGRRQGVSPADRFYSLSPFFHASGFMHALLVCMVHGAVLHTTGQYDIEETLATLARERITISHGVPLPFADERAAGVFEREGGLAIERFWTGGSRADMESLEAQSGGAAYGIYGLTETGGCAAICSVGDPPDVRNTTSGRTLPGVEAKIITPETGEDAARGEVGEILIRGWNLMLGYFRDAAATRDAIDDAGWLHTGDRGRLDAGENLVFLGRLKDVIRVSGENFAAAEVEAVIEQIAGVTEAAVVAIPDDRHGEVPVAFVVTAPDVEVSAETLRAECSSALASFKVPVQWIAVPTLPRTDATHRVQKSRLLDQMEHLPRLIAAR